jgi:hypothetical protein
VEAEEWLPAGPLTVGLTAGASTPNNKIGEAIELLLRTRGRLSGAHRERLHRPRDAALPHDLLRPAER